LRRRPMTLTSSTPSRCTSCDEPGNDALGPFATKASRSACETRPPGPEPGTYCKRNNSRRIKGHTRPTFASRHSKWPLPGGQWPSPFLTRRLLELFLDLAQIEGAWRLTGWVVLHGHEELSRHGLDRHENKRPVEEPVIVGVRVVVGAARA